MRKLTTKTLQVVGFFLLYLFSLPLFSQVPVNINSGDPAFPFPQFLEYAQGKTLALYNAEGVTHCDMEKSMSEAYQVMANRFDYTGTVIDGVQLIRGNLGCPYDCAEGEGYAMLAAAYMGDKTTFDGLWMRVHDDMVVRTPRYEDGVENFPTYRYGRYTIKEESGDAAADGDWDIGLALLMATKQWGANSGVTVDDGNGGTKEMSYLYEAFHIINDFVDTVGIDDGSGNGIDGYVTGHIGIDGYPKGGNTFGENTNWGATLPINPSTEVFANDYNQDGFGSYIAPAYYRSFAKFLEDNGGTTWSIEQYKKAEASSEWIMEQNHAQGRLPFAGAYDVDGANVTFKAGDPTQGKSDGEAFRMAWRTVLNYVWRGDGIYGWDPTTHSYDLSGNTAMKDNADELAAYIADPGICDALGSSPDPVSTTINHQGISQVRQNVLGDGSTGTKNWTNFTLGTSAPAVAANGDPSLIAQLYRQLELKWDDQDKGLAETDTIITDSEPEYFHGWFRLLGMLTLSGNLHAPENMVAGSNMKVYLSVDKTFAFIDDEVTYTVDYRNYGSLAATGVSISVNVDPQYEVIDAGGASASGNALTYAIGTVPGVQSATGSSITTGQRTFKVRVKAPKVTDRVCQTVTINNGNGPGWTSNEYPNNCSYTMERNCVDILGERSLKITKTSDREEVNPGNEVTFKLKFENSSDAGWLNGGRQHVNFSYGYAQSGPNSYFHLFRNWNNADEAYIDLSNYRMSFFMYDEVNKGIYDAGSNPNGWSLIGKNLQTGNLADFNFIGEEIPVGQDGTKKWNQRLIIQFPPDITAPTHTVLSHLNNRYQLHKGTLKPIWYSVQMEANPAAPLFAGRLDDDWSFVGPEFQYAVGSGAEPYSLIGPNYADYNNPGMIMDRFDRDACSGFFTPDKIFTKVLVEEYDGYTWRRVSGDGPAPGREMYNVEILDTIPSDFTFVRFEKDVALDSLATVYTSGGYEIIKWRTSRMLVGSLDSIEYVVEAKGSCLPTPMADKKVVNYAWIYSDTDSPTYDSACVTITCEEIIEPPLNTTMTKTADQPSYSTGETATYTIDFEQTLGTQSVPPLDDASRWTARDGNTLPAFNTGDIDFDVSKSNIFITEDYSHGQNGTLITHIDNEGEERFGLVFRYTGGTRTATQGLFLEMKLGHWGTDAIITLYENGNPLETIQKAQPTPIDEADIKVVLVDDKLSVYINDLNGLPFYTFENITNLDAGYVGFVQGEINGNSSQWSKPKITNWDAHFDSAFDLQLADVLPDDLTFVSASDGGTESNGRVEWPLIPGPVLYGTTFQHTVSATVDGCPASGDLINNAYVNLFGLAVDATGANAVSGCGGVTLCENPGTVGLNITATEDVCGSSLEIIATPTGTAPTGGFEFEFFYDDGSGFTSVQAASSDNTYIATATGDYYVEVTDPADPTTCSAVSITSTITFSTPLTPDVTIDVDNTTLCEGQIANFSIDVASDSGATPTYQWLVNDVAVSLETNNTFSTATLSNGDVVSLEMTIAETCNTKFIDTSNEIVMTINPVLTPEVTIAADVLTICNGETVNFDIASAVDSGVTPTYRWLVNDIAVSAEINNTFSTASLVDGDVISLEMTIAETCQTKSIDTSNAILISVGNPLTPQVTITSDATAICAGETVNFSIATAVDSGSTPTYRWLVNDVAVSAEVNNTFSTASLTNGDVVSLEMTIAETCITKGQDTSNVVAISVSGSVTPTAVIAATTSINICPGDSVAIEVTEQNGAGASPTYEWYINNVLDGTQTSDMFSSKTLTTGDSVYVTISDLSSCATATSVISEAIYINEIAPLTPSITIDMSTSTICAGETVDFSILSAIDSGATPTYQWLLNDVAISLANEHTYSTTTLTNGDIISLEMTIAETCHTKTIDTSNQETITVTSPVTPQVTINASANTICTGDIVDFSILSASDSGTTPSYEWLLNGSPISLETNNTLSINTLTDNDSIAIVMTSSETCVAVTKDTSNYVPITVTGAIAPEVTIVATTATTICAGDSVAFEVTNTIGDNGSPAFEWFINGVSTSQTGVTFFSKTLVDEDTVTVRMSGTSTCATVTDTLSNAIGITITPAGVPDITINADKNLICAGEEVNFSIASQTNEGTNPTYEWFVNTASNGTGTTFSSSSLVTGDDITVVMTSDLSCAAVPTAISNIETITVSAPVTPSVSITADQTDACMGTTVNFDTLSTTHQGNGATYQWLLNDTPINSATSIPLSTTTLSATDKISLEMTVTETCVTSQSVTSNEVSVNMITGATPTIDLITTSPNVCGTDPISFTTSVTNEGTSPLYRWYIDDNIQLVTSSTYDTPLLSNAEIKVELISDAPCAFPLSVSDSIDMNVFPAINPDVIALAPVECNQMLISASGNLATTYQWYKDNDVITNATSSLLTITESGNYSVEVGNGVCTSEISSGKLLSIYQTPTVSAGSNTTIYTGDDYTMNGSVDVATSTISWTSNNSDVITDASSLNAIVEPTTTTVYTITADNNGCTDTASVVISVVKPVLIPNVFTPNGTGTNDTWVIDGLETYSDCSVTVFNRWGMKVFNTAGYDSPWDGCMEDGKLLPTATYFYVIDLGDGTEPISGTVTIIK